MFFNVLTFALIRKLKIIIQTIKVKLIEIKIMKKIFKEIDLKITSCAFKLFRNNKKFDLE